MITERVCAIPRASPKDKCNIPTLGDYFTTQASGTINHLNNSQNHDDI